MANFKLLRMGDHYFKTNEIKGISSSDRKIPPVRIPMQSEHEYIITIMKYDDHCFHFSFEDEVHRDETFKYLLEELGLN